MKLNPSDKMCLTCNGSGIIPPSERKDGGTIAAICSDCDGDGKFDWVEQVVGKKKFNIDPNRTIVAYVEPPDNPREADFYFNTTLKMPMIFTNNRWKPFDYFGDGYEAKSRRS